MKRALILPLPLLLACGAEPIEQQPPPMMMMMPPDMQPDPMPSNDCSTQPAGQTIQAQGEASGFWSGRVELLADTTVASGEVLEICPGTVIVPSMSARLIVKGELLISGTRDATVTFEEMPWGGIQVEGKLSGGYVSIAGGNVCIEGQAGSEIELVSAMLVGCRQGFNLANGARFDRVTVIGGSSILIRGGVLTMIDSLVDLRRPLSGPDCLVWSDGGANLDHVHVTGCHCPLHIGRASLGVTVTNSILDGGSVPIMIANTSGTIAGNNIPAGSPQLQDIGGNISADVGGNYWGGGAPRVTGNTAQFTNLSDYAQTPFEDAGPR